MTYMNYIEFPVIPFEIASPSPDSGFLPPFCFTVSDLIKNNKRKCDFHNQYPTAHCLPLVALHLGLIYLQNYYYSNTTQFLFQTCTSPPTHTLRPATALNVKTVCCLTLCFCCCFY